MHTMAPDRCKMKSLWLNTEGKWERNKTIIKCSQAWESV